MIIPNKIRIGGQDISVSAQLLHSEWKEYAEVEMIVRWAYIKDLLPKGGEK